LVAKGKDTATEARMARQQTSASSPTRSENRVADVADGCFPWKSSVEGAGTRWGV